MPIGQNSTKFWAGSFNAIINLLFYTVLYKYINYGMLLNNNCIWNCNLEENLILLLF